MSRTSGVPSSGLVLDVDGLPGRCGDAKFWGLPYVACLVVVNLGLQLLLRAVFDGARAMTWGLAVLALLAGGAGLVAVGARAHLSLEAAGYRRYDGLRYGRLRSWEEVGEVRPSSRWNEHPELRGKCVSDVAVSLVGLSDEDARELQRRLEAARTAAEDAGRAQG